jgi:hypothetical protein
MFRRATGDRLSNKLRKKHSLGYTTVPQPVDSLQFKSSSETLFNLSNVEKSCLKNGSSTEVSRSSLISRNNEQELHEERISSKRSSFVRKFSTLVRSVSVHHAEDLDRERRFFYESLSVLFKRRNKTCNSFCAF